MKIRLIKHVLLFLLFIFYANKGHAVDFDSIRVISNEFPPLSYTKNGKIIGRSVELLIRASEAVGSPITRGRITMLAWPRAYKMGTTEKNVMVFSTARTETREKLFKWAGPIGKHRTVVWAKKSSKIDKIDDITKISEKLVVIRNSIDDQLLMAAKVPEEMISRVPQPEYAAKMLAKDRLRLWVYNEYTAIEKLKEIGENIDDYEIINVIKSNDLYFAFSKDVDDRIVELLQKGIEMVWDDFDMREFN